MKKEDILYLDVGGLIQLKIDIVIHPKERSVRNYLKVQKDERIFNHSHIMINDTTYLNMST